MRLITLLLLFISFLTAETGSSVLSSGSSQIIQDQKPTGDFIERAAPPVSETARNEMEARLEDALRVLEAKPNDPEASIWLGRRLAYLGRFREAIDVYSKGITKFPNDARFYRHRGHRYITLRRFDLAINDLRKSAKLIKGKPDEVEPDGQPNARNIPASTLQFNIWYHLGLAQYLTGQNQQALSSYRECLKVSKNPDSVVATSHWLYMTLRRMDRTREAAKVIEPIRPGLDIIENDGYYRLLLMYKGLSTPGDLSNEALKQEASAGSASILYGVGNWYLYNGQRDEALKVFRRMIAGSQWTSFGYIAAETDLRRKFGLMRRTI